MHEAPGRRPGGGGARSSAAGSAGTASRSCGRCATTATPTRRSPRRCGASPSAAASATPTRWAAARAATPSTSGCPTPTRAPSPSPTASPTSGRCSPPTPRPPAGRGRTRPGCSPVTSSRCGAPAASGRWPPARRCSWAPSGSSSSTGYDNRLEQVRTHIGAETLDYEQVDVPAELREMTGGRGPDVCIEAVGHGGAQHRPAVPLRPGQAAAAAADRPADRGAGGDLRLPQGRDGVRPRASSAASSTSSRSAR